MLNFATKHKIDTYNEKFSYCANIGLPRTALTVRDPNLEFPFPKFLKTIERAKKWTAKFYDKPTLHSSGTLTVIIVSLFFSSRVKRMIYSKHFKIAMT